VIFVSGGSKKKAKRPEGKKSPLKALKGKIRVLEGEMEKREKEFGELKEILQRVQADYENAMKRKEKETEIEKKRAEAEILKAFLPVLDSVEQALKHSQDSGLKELHSQLLNAFRQCGVSEINCGEKFNPDEMDCVLRASDSEKPEGAVLEEFQKGYRFGGGILRPAKVKANFPEEKKQGKEK